MMRSLSTLHVPMNQNNSLYTHYFGFASQCNECWGGLGSVPTVLGLRVCKAWRDLDHFPYPVEVYLRHSTPTSQSYKESRTMLRAITF